jgi:hypothetical protein
MFTFQRHSPISEARSWCQILFAAVGGLTETGFSEDETLLLVVSHDGRGLFDLGAGKRIARDDDMPLLDSPWIDRTLKRVQGIGLAAETWFPVVGLWGGALSKGNSAGWVAEIVSKRRQDLAFIGRDKQRWLVARPITEIKAFGFSASGHHLALATSCDITVFRHEGEHRD